MLTILLDEPFALGAIATFDLKPIDFGAGSHKLIFSAIKSVYERGDNPGLATVEAELQRVDTSDRLELGELESIAAAIVHPSQATGLARRIKVASLARLADSYAERKEYEQAAVHQKMAMALLDGETTTTSRRFTFYTIDELASRPPQRFLIDDMIVAGSLVDFFGPPASLKSAVVLGQSLSVASGIPWNGRAVEQGAVVYVAGEGEGGISKRIRAWRIMHPDADPADFYVLPDMVRALDDHDVESFLNELPCEPSLIVIDTLSRSLAGGNENAPDDMGKFVATVDRIRRETGATVIVIHHSDKAGNYSRGHSSFLAAVDTEIEAKLDGDGRVTLRCRKQKDHDEFLPIPLIRRIVDLDEDGVESSIVLLLTTFNLDNLSDAGRLVLDALQRFDAAGASPTEWWDSAREAGVAKSTFYRVKSHLIDNQIVRMNGENFVAVPQSHPGPIKSHGPNGLSPTGVPSLKDGTPGQDRDRDGNENGNFVPLIGRCWICEKPLAKGETGFCAACGEMKPI